MKTLQECTWKEFRTIDIFSEINIGKSYDLNRLHIIGRGGTNYVCRSSKDNGIQCEISDNIEPNAGNCITVAMVGECGTSFYQDAGFVCSQNVLILRTNQLNRYNGLFLCRIIELEKPRFSYGRTLTKKWFENARMYIPATSDGTPDWQYMEDYMRAVEHKLLAQALPILQEKVNKQSNIQLPTLEKKEWRTFYIRDIFTIENCKCSKVSGIKEGNMPYVGATNNNNGVLKFIERREQLITKGNCIVFICDGEGSIGLSFYKYEDFIGTTTVKVGRCPQLNRYIGMFISTVADTVRGKYNFGYKRNENNLKKESLLLPVSLDGTPDYAYMENYMRSLEAQQLRHYLTYKK